MNEKPIFALMYDFDKTLSPRDMQEYGFIPSVGMTPGNFWQLCRETSKNNGMDAILAYMLVMCQKARGKLVLTQDTMRCLGADVELFSGVESWFSRVNDYAAAKGMKAEHYIISSGLKVVIEGTPIASEFEKIYAAEFVYDSDGVPVWPAMAVNYTSKTQFIFRINKGVLDITDDDGVNEFMPDNERRVPFRNMVYVGDGMTDVPCMKIVRLNGGYSIAVYQNNRENVNSLVLDGRVDYVLPADYTENSDMEKCVFALIDKAAADNVTVGLHKQSLDAATKQREQELFRRMSEK